MLGGCGNLVQQIRVKCAFDAKQLLDPRKVFPVLHRCAELHKGQLPFPDVPSFRSAPRSAL
ncbi:MAG: hypothetical protein DLM68_16255 [Hyphomicrobiales bacterium]|nr:MAG: hypothetical protein DLM68_16255 [Hyphomicrobiales bacterium]